MSIYSKRAAALTWNRQGECHGALVCLHGQQPEVLKLWSDKAASLDAMPSLLAQGYTQLGLTEDVVLIAGEEGPAAAMIDREFPVLSQSELNKAIAVASELAFPLPQSRLMTFARCIKKNNQSMQLRIIAIPQEKWSQWLVNISQLRVDYLMPVAAVSDSYFHAPIIIHDDSRSWLLTAAPSLSIRNLPASFSTENIVDKFINNLNLPLDAKYTPALLLALYPLSKNAVFDKKLVPALPTELQPKRHLLQKHIMVAGVIYTLLFIVFSAGLYGISRYRDLSKIEDATKQLQHATPAVDFSLNEKLKKLQQESQNIIHDIPRTSHIILEITKILPKEFYIKDITIDEALVHCQIKGHELAGQSDKIYTNFLNSELFDDDISMTNSGDALQIVLKISRKRSSNE